VLQQKLLTPSEEDNSMSYFHGSPVPSTFENLPLEKYRKKAATNSATPTADRDTPTEYPDLKPT
jgi:hypothetical protein